MKNTFFFVPTILLIFISFLLILFISTNIDPYTIVDISISYKNNIYSRSLLGSVINYVSEIFNFSFVTLALVTFSLALIISLILFINQLTAIGINRASMIFILLMPFSYAFYLNNFSYVILRRDIFLILLIQIFYLLIKKTNSSYLSIFTLIVINLLGMLIHIMSLFIVLPITVIFFLKKFSSNYIELLLICIGCFFIFFGLTYVSSSPIFSFNPSFANYGITSEQYQIVVSQLANQNSNSLITELKIFVINLPYFLIALLFLIASFFSILKSNLKYNKLEYIFVFFYCVLLLIAHDHGRFFTIFFISLFYLNTNFFKKSVFASKSFTKVISIALIMFSLVASLPHYFGLPIIQYNFLTYIIDYYFI